MIESSNADAEWWRSGVIYQIYPRSFADSDGDGIGDLRGIEQRLGHVAELGVDAIWVSPIYASPMVDFGYDVTDHCDVDPTFGTLEDAERLVATAHDVGLRVIFDLIPSHTSDQHPWFIESRRDRDNPKRDWYLWRDPAPDGGPPNNWVSEFGGPAWTFDQRTGQYYCHAHLPEQPDLNWRHEGVVDAMSAVVRFWFDRGVDGFRVDAVDQAIKHPDFIDNPPNPDWHAGRPPTERFLRTNQKDRPELHRHVTRVLRRLADEAGGRILASEAYLPFERMAIYHGAGGDGFHLPYNFHLIGVDWDPRAIADLVERYETSLPDGAWPNWVLGNHDRPRIGSRVGRAQARVAAMLLLTLRGTPTIYYGDELGMVDVPIAPERVQDPVEHRLPGLGLGRDPQRTPIAWTDGLGAGFTEGEPWLPIDNRPDLVVERQRDDPASMLNLYRRLIALRKAERTLRLGRYETVHADDGVLVYARAHEDRRLVVALNLTSRARPVPDLGETLMSTDPLGRGDPAELGPDEGRISVG